MIRGLYTACAGMLAQLGRQDVIANNIANVNSTGYKRDVAVCESFPQMLMQRMGELETAGEQVKPLSPQPIGTVGTGAVIAQIATDYSAGNLQKTENSLDLAIAGEGYFVVQTPQGERYTRDGAFKLSDEGVLITSQGYAVLGRDGPIRAQGGNLVVDENGNVLAGGEMVDTLRVVGFDDQAMLVKTGDNLFNSDNGAARDIPQPRVLQGYLESSNVNAVKEMVELINVVRAYEANQKVIQAHDQMLDAAVNRVGSV